MAPLNDSFLENLLAADRVVKGYDLLIPGFENLDKSQEAQVIDRLQQEEREGKLERKVDPKALEDALLNLLPHNYGIPRLDDYKNYLDTAFLQSNNVNDFYNRLIYVPTEPLIDSRAPTPPGPTAEEQLIEDRYFEILARQDLEADGCPPCYPPDLQIPLRDIPEEYQAIISYWRFFSCHNKELVGQWRDWEAFRDYQKRVRYDYDNTKRRWSKYVDLVRERRRKNGLEGDACLRLTLEEHDQKLENWIEFQAYHIHTCIEKFEKELYAQNERKDDLRKRAESADPAVSKEALEVIQSGQQHWKYQEQQLEMERCFLHWTEQRRIAMISGHQTTVEGDRDDGMAAIRRAPILKGGKRDVKAHSVLGEPRVSKCQSQKRSVRHHKPKAPDTAAKAAPPTMNFRPSTSNISQISDSPETESRRPKTQTSRRQYHPQKVYKAKRFENASSKLVVISQRRAIERKVSLDAQSPRQSQLALINVTTRSGRVSRPPVKWVQA